MSLKWPRNWISTHFIFYEQFPHPLVTYFRLQSNWDFLNGFQRVSSSNLVQKISWKPLGQPLIIFAISSTGCHWSSAASAPHTHTFYLWETKRSSSALIYIHIYIYIYIYIYIHIYIYPLCDQWVAYHPRFWYKVYERGHLGDIYIYIYIYICMYRVTTIT